MLTFRDITLADRELVMPMVQAFYQTDAVDHPVDQAILDRSFLAAADHAEPLLRGVLLFQDKEPVGYIYPSARRFRLEVTEVNQRAVALYAKSGYQYLHYDQMVLDKVSGGLDEHI